MIDFTEEQIERYSRNILLNEVGAEGQDLLLHSKVLVVGAGGLGSPAILYLAAAGVGEMGIIDGDNVDLSNLQRQIIHSTADLGRNKAESAKESVNALNPDVQVHAYPYRLTVENASDIISKYDFIIDGTDNFASKMLVNDACVMLDKPFSIAGILRFCGQTFTHTPGTACFRCIYGEPPDPADAPTCAQSGVLGAIAGMLGTIQATEALKYLLHVGTLLTDRLFYVDAATMVTQQFRVSHNPDCPVCGSHPTITTLQEYSLPTCRL